MKKSQGVTTIIIIITLVIVNKKKRTCQTVDFAVPIDHRVKLKESEKRDKYLDLARELKTSMEHESDGDTNCNQCARYSHPLIDTALEVLEIRGRVETIQTRALLR